MDGGGGRKEGVAVSGKMGYLCLAEVKGRETCGVRVEVRHGEGVEGV